MLKIFLSLFFLLHSCDFLTTNTRTHDFQQKKESWLINLKTTGRISSNHFSDFVIDDEGSSYVASFLKMENDKDQLLIIKVDRNGKVLWEKGQNSLGRATAVGIDSNQNIWVTGYFQKQLIFGEQQISSESDCSFLAQFDQRGECLRLIKIADGAVGFDCHVNSKNEILLTGNFGGQLTIQNISLVSKNNASTFFAKFDSKGNCQWIEDFNGNVARMRSDHFGNFYATGDFHERLDFQNKHWKTKSTWDSDGFILKMDNHGKLNWLHQFGNKGATKYGYRTQEGGQELLVNDHKIYVIARTELPNPDDTPDSKVHTSHQISTIELLIFDEKGKLQQQQEISKSASDHATLGMVFTQNGNLWISGNGHGKVELLDEVFSFENPQSFLIQLDKKFQKKKIIIPDHGSNTIFRVANAHAGNVLLSGHFQSLLKIDNKTITNDGRHGLFLLKLKDGD